MQVIIIKTDGTQLDITDKKVIGNYSFSGNNGSGAREMSITFLNNFKVGVGDTISFTDGVYSFVGQIYDLDRENKQASQTIEFADYMMHLENSKDTMVVNSTPESVVREICNRISIAVGNVVSTGIATGERIYEKQTYYDIITDLYSRAGKSTGKKYKVFMNGATLNVEEKGKIIDYVLSDKTNCDSIRYSESMRNLINKVVQYDDKHKKIGEKVGETASRVGIFQDVADKDDNINEMLTDIEYKLYISGIGDNSCISGNYVRFIDGETGVSGIYEIIQDSHTVKSGSHRMNLTLEFRSFQ